MMSRSGLVPRPLSAFYLPLWGDEAKLDYILTQIRLLTISSDTQIPSGGVIYSQPPWWHHWYHSTCRQGKPSGMTSAALLNNHFW